MFGMHLIICMGFSLNENDKGWFLSGAAPSAEEEHYDLQPRDEDTIPGNDVTYMSRF